LDPACAIFAETNQQIMKKGFLMIRRVWLAKKGQLKQSIASVTNNDVLFQEGQREEMAGRLQMKLGKSLKELFKL
jgi:uncharacterized protein YjbJ (UPF0337 family)